MKYIIFLLSILLLTGVSSADSPLSTLGYGLYQESAGTRAAGMGQVSLAVPDSGTLNPIVPALWGGSQSVRLGFNLSWNRTTAKNQSGSDMSDEAGFAGVAFAIPIGKGSYVGASLTPATRVGYRSISQQPGTWNTQQIYREGNGGLSQGLLAISIPAGQRLRVGLGFRPLFGKIERLYRVEFPGAPSGTELATHTYSERYEGFGGHASVLWLGGDWTAAASINSPVSTSAQRQTVIRNGSSILSDTTVKRPESHEFPWDIALGLGKKLGRHTTGLEVAWQGWEMVDTPPEMNNLLTDGIRISLGWEWSPEGRPLDPLHRRLIYRGGAYYTENYALNSNGWQPRKLALSAGIGIPYFNKKSRLDLALEFGWSGADRPDAVLERSVALKIGLNHSEIWFEQRRGKH